jgi:hypothetical protein
MFVLKTPVVSQYRWRRNYTPSRYGLEWDDFSVTLRMKYKRCQWCNKLKDKKNLDGHHIGCVKYNYEFLLDERVVIIVCRECHDILEQWSRIKLEQMLPQLFEN